MPRIQHGDLIARKNMLYFTLEREEVVTKGQTRGNAGAQSHASMLMEWQTAENEPKVLGFGF